VGRGDSRLAGRLVFCVGARRSGTYWVQRIVAAHPAASAVPGETYLFSHGIAPLMERFHHGPRTPGQVGKVYADRGILLDAVRDFCDRVLGEFLEPGAERLAERTPHHVYHLGLIAEIYPDAHFVHIVRDGRDVARSLVAQDWGPDTIAAAAEEWRSSVVAGREGAPREGYLEVRYEELLADVERGVRVLYEHVGLPATPEALALGLAAARDSSLNVDASDPRVAAGKWEGSISERDLREIERVAGELLAELGYADRPRRGGLLRRRG
jgi:Sulfotransferase family